MPFFTPGKGVRRMDTANECHRYDSNVRHQAVITFCIHDARTIDVTFSPVVEGLAGLHRVVLDADAANFKTNAADGWKNKSKSLENGRWCVTF